MAVGTGNRDIATLGVRHIKRDDADLGGCRGGRGDAKVHGGRSRMPDMATGRQRLRMKLVQGAYQNGLRSRSARRLDVCEINVHDLTTSGVQEGVRQIRGDNMRLKSIRAVAALALAFGILGSS